MESVGRIDVAFSYITISFLKKSSIYLRVSNNTYFNSNVCFAISIYSSLLDKMANSAIPTGYAASNSIICSFIFGQTYQIKVGEGHPITQR